MYFTNGNYVMGGNFKIKKAAPMDDRGTVAKKIDLQNPNLFDGFTYNGMIVSVVDDTINNGLYRLEDKSTLTWKKEWSDVNFTASLRDKLMKVSDNNRGAVSNETALASIANPIEGDFALVRSTLAFWAYESGAWVDTHSSTTAGSDGLSAYELDVLTNGYSGTLEQWLIDLKGEPGTNFEYKDFLEDFSINGKHFDENNNIELEGVSTLVSPELNLEKLTEYRHPVTKKPLYTKTIDFGYLPNNATKVVPHNVPNIEDTIIDYSNSYIYTPGIKGFSFSGFSVWSDLAYQIGSYVDNGYIVVGTGNDRTNMKAIFTINYTKTTDTAESPVRLIGGGGTGGDVDLSDYYKKTETYSKVEVDTKIADIPPTDLSGYYTKTQTETLLSNKVDKVTGKGLSTNDFTDTFKQALELKKVQGISTDSVTKKLVVNYTDSTVANLNINDIITDVHVSGATLNATTNVLTLTSTDGGANVTVDLSDFVNSGELTSALSGKADNIHSHSTSNITGLDATLSNKVTKNAAIIGATKTKITYDSNGLVTNGADLSASDIPNLPQSKIINLETNLSSKIDKGAGVVGATKTKITYNNDGIITGGADLVEADLPNISQAKITNLVSDLSNKQAKLVSSTNIKTINGQSVLGSGDIVITGVGSVQLTGNETIAGIKTFTSNIVGDITGNAATATKLATARTINGVAFDGSANITVSDSTAVKLTGDQTIAGTKTFSSNIVGNVTGNLSGNAASATSATKLTTPRQINGVNFDGSADITVVDNTKVSLTGNETIAGTKTFSSTVVGNISGNAGTATKLQTARTINGVAFDGSANITVSDDTKLTKTNPSIIGSVTEQVYNLTGTVINPTNGTIQYKTVSSDTTFTETLISGQSVLLRLINATSYTITFPTITWVGADAPILTANCVIALWKEQSTLYGAYIGTLVW